MWALSRGRRACALRRDGRRGRGFLIVKFLDFAKSLGGFLTPRFLNGRKIYHVPAAVAGAVRGSAAKLQKRAFSAYEHKHWILMRAERAGALPGHARSALAGHRTRGAR